LLRGDIRQVFIYEEQKSWYRFTIRNRPPLLACPPAFRAFVPRRRFAAFPFFRKVDSNPLDSHKTWLNKALFFGTERMPNGIRRTAERASNRGQRSEENALRGAGAALGERLAWSRDVKRIVVALCQLAGAAQT
jgi:hypothetical protein